jgi:hypothetical protein
VKQQRDHDAAIVASVAPVVDAVDHETRPQHERVRDHRVIFGVGVFLDGQILLNDSLGVGKERPRRAN